MEEDKQKRNFAVRWRDRYIRELTDALEGREQEAKLLAALLKCLIVKCVVGEIRQSCDEEPPGVDGRSLLIGKSEVAGALGRYRASVTEEAEAYRVTLEPLGVLSGDDA